MCAGCWVLERLENEFEAKPRSTYPRMRVVGLKSSKKVLGGMCQSEKALIFKEKNTVSERPRSLGNRASVARKPCLGRSETVPRSLGNRASVARKPCLGRSETVPYFWDFL